MNSEVKSLNFIAMVRNVYRLLENSEHSAFPVTNNENQPIGLIERDALIAMIENSCWYYRKSKASANFGENRPLLINQTGDHSEAAQVLGGANNVPDNHFDNGDQEV